MTAKTARLLLCQTVLTNGQDFATVLAVTDHVEIMHNGNREHINFDKMSEWRIF